MCDVAVIVLAFNEELNIEHALQSVCGWAREVHVVDSGSTDQTPAVAERFDCELHYHAFDDYARQRNWALSELPVRSEWVLFLDADEWLPTAIKDEIAATIAGNPIENGFYLNRRLLWMGKWVRRGYYPTWILRLFRYGKGRCEQRAVNEHIVVDGKVGRLKHDFVHEDRNPISRWVAKHDRYATAEAQALVTPGTEDPGNLWSGQATRKRWIRRHIWNRMPTLVRPVLYYGYRYFLRGGFLDGRAGLAYHVLQGLYFPMLIDIKYLELVRGREARPARVRDPLGE